MRTKTELEALAQRNGWKPRPLTAADIAAISSTEYEYQSIFNAKELERAVNEPAEKARNKAIANANDLVRIWSGKATPAEQSDMTEAAKKFAANYPQFIGTSVANGEKIATWFKKHNARPDYSGFVQAFEELTSQNNLTLSLQALGKSAVNGRRVREIQDRIMRERKIRNDRVAESKAAEEAMQVAISELPDKLTYISDLSPEQTKLILSPATAQQQFSTPQSAEQYRTQSQTKNPEDWDFGPSAYEQESWDKAVRSFRSFHPEYIPSTGNREKIESYLRTHKLPLTQTNLDLAYSALAGQLELNEDAVVRSGVTKRFDLGGNPPSYIETSIPTKTDPLTDAELKSFQRKKLELTSDSLMAECKKSVRFRMWLDGELS